MNGHEWLSSVFDPALTESAIRSDDRHRELRGQLLLLFDCEVLDGPTLANALGRLDDARDRARREYERTRPRVRPAGTYAPPPTNTLVRVLAPAVALADIDTTTFVLTSVELWERQVHLLIAALSNAVTEQADADHRDAIRSWASRRMPGERPPAPSMQVVHSLLLRLTDDVGTPYERTRGGSGQGSDSDYRGHDVFKPGVPATATCLTVHVCDDDGRPLTTVDIPL